MVKIIVVIPALNEDSTIADVIRRVPQPARTIVVDDGSTDQTVVNAERAGAEVVRHDRNRGYDDALASGFAPLFRLMPTDSMIRKFSSMSSHVLKIWIPSSS